MSNRQSIQFYANREVFTSDSTDAHLRLQLNAIADRADYELQSALMSELMDRYAHASAELEKRNRELKHSNEIRLEAQRLAHLGSWNLDLICQTLSWSDTMYELLGLDCAGKPSVQRFMDCLHPDDLPYVRTKTEGLLAGHVPEDLVYRLLMPGGQVRWVRAQHVGISDASGVVKSVHGTLQDITDTKTAELNQKKYSGHLEELVREKVREISSSQLATIYALVKLAESRDDDTGEHIERTSRYCRRLAELAREHGPYAAQLDDAFIENITLASPLHDIGKVGIPDHILLKPGRLTPDEFALMKAHVTIGYQTLASVESLYPESDYLKIGMEITRYHHEKWDGSGYREGLAGEAIPLAARIMAIGDVYDALRSRRVYKEPYPHEECVRIMVEGRGQHFDPVLIDLFTAHQKDFQTIFDTSKHA